MGRLPLLGEILRGFFMQQRQPLPTYNPINRKINFQDKSLELMNTIFIVSPGQIPEKRRLTG
jgi:hypothetical protein